MHNMVHEVTPAVPTYSGMVSAAPSELSLLSNYNATPSGLSNYSTVVPDSHPLSDLALYIIA